VQVVQCPGVQKELGLSGDGSFGHCLMGSVKSASDNTIRTRLRTYAGSHTGLERVRDDRPTQLEMGKTRQAHL
jgi:hypothetical protein